MAWQLQGEWIQSCSCDMVCPCLWGPQTKPTQGWCSAAIGLNIRQGNSDGVDLSNLRAVWAGDFPGNFQLGNGTGRVYLDESMSADQRRELDSILTGKKGGVWEALAAAISNQLPTKTARIALDSGEDASISVSGAGDMTLKRMKDQNGTQTELMNSPVGTAFGLPREALAFSEGQWGDPEMRTWQAGGGGYGGVASFSWRV